MDVDLRSEACASLKELNGTFLDILKQAVAAENRARSTREGRIDVDPRLIGNRPCGDTALTAPIVRTASAVVQAFGMTPDYNISSTDANVPMSMGLPAITIGRGGPGGRSHAPDEWTDVEPVQQSKAVQVALATILSVAGAK
jgi:di/tripeptidase